MLDLTRQSGLVPPEVVDEVCITVIGCGAIGSHVCKQLAQLGIRELKVYDDDIVSAHNLPNQGFGLPDLGKNKAEVVKERLWKDFGCVVEAVPYKYTGEALTTKIVISAVDSMSARKLIWEASKRDEVECFIDGRMGAEYAQVFTLIGGHGAEYEKHYLFGDSEASPAPCTEKATIYCASLVSGLMTSGVKTFVTTGGTNVVGVGFDTVNMVTNVLI
jgi:molybdopterin/thiamine biosynthesis adenylyltransferase